MKTFPHVESRLVPISKRGSNKHPACVHATPGALELLARSDKAAGVIVGALIARVPINGKAARLEACHILIAAHLF